MALHPVTAPSCRGRWGAAKTAYEGFLSGGEMTPDLPPRRCPDRRGQAPSLDPPALHRGGVSSISCRLALDHILFVLRPVSFFAPRSWAAPVAGLGLHGGAYDHAGAGGDGRGERACIHRRAADRGLDRLMLGVENTLGWGQHARAHRRWSSPSGFCTGWALPACWAITASPPSASLWRSWASTSGWMFGQLAVIAMAFRADVGVGHPPQLVPPGHRDPGLSGYRRGGGRIGWLERTLL